MKKLLFLYGVLVFGVCAIPAISQTSATSAPDKQVIDNPDVLRGFGKIKATFEIVTGADKQPIHFWHFDATSKENAAAVAGKCLADVTLSPGVSSAPTVLGAKTFSFITVPGGSVYTAFANGKTGYVLAADHAATLEAYLKTSPLVAQGTTDLAYPIYLDRFDRYGWGFYGFRGEWEGKSPGDGLQFTDPKEDLDFCQKYNFRFELWPEVGQFDDSYSIDEWSAMDWQITEASKRNIPLSCRFYGGLPHVKEFEQAFEQPAFFLQGGWHGPDLAQKTWPHQSWFDEKGRLYVARQAQQLMKPLNDRTDIGSWMSPYGELYHDEWYNMHADYSPSALDNWIKTVRDEKHLTLGQLSKMYARQDKPFKSWSEVTIPEMATFTGLPGMIKDLDGDWYVRVESKPDEGLQNEWWKAEVKSGNWTKLNLPGSVYWLCDGVKPIRWCIREFDLQPDLLASGKPIYLYNFAKIYGDPRALVPIYLNGQKVGETGGWGAIDVSKYLQAGPNRLAIKTQYFTGRVFLSTEEPSVYPYLGADRNQLWIMWKDWLSDGKHDTWADALAAMRQKDPNRPIKFMAPGGFGNDRWLDLASRYGGFGHFTGEGLFTYVWYKRYGFLYGLPSTSEDAGPPKNLEEMFATYQRVFLEGLNGHDHVFTVQDTTGRPDVKAWYENHIAVLKQLGRWDIAGPQIISYRSTNNAATPGMLPFPPLGEKSRPIQSIWNWDFGRGAMQAVGYSTLYVDDDGIATGKIDGYPIMIDDGNEIMTPEALQNIEKWVRAGGTYITLPFAGRSIPSAPDSWPISALTGCKVKTLREPGKGTITISANQPLFKDLAGQSFPDAGHCLDWQDFEHNILSVELEPGADCQVAATYENGAPAIVVHKLGAGRVIALGSAFFRQSHDLKGIWIAGDLETKFLRDLFTQLGQPSVNYTSNPLVYAQRYKTNNGLDDVVVLDNFSGADQSVTLNVTLTNPSQKVYQVAMNSILEPAATVDKLAVTVPNIVVPKNEVQVFYLRNHSPDDSIRHWWAYQQKIWRSSNPIKVDFSPIAKAPWVDPVIDLKHDWKWTQNIDPEDDWTKASYDDSSWSKWGLDIFSAVGADPTKPIHARRTFTVPSVWLTDGGITRLVAAGWNTDFTIGKAPWKFILNGQQLDKDSFFNPEVGPWLKKGSNTLSLAIGPTNGAQYTGVLGTVYLTHYQPPIKRVNLAGYWVSSIDGVVSGIHFPGKGKIAEPKFTFHIPADWKDRYTVTYHVVGKLQQTLGVAVNDAAIRRHHHMFGNDAEIDITPLLHFGEDNIFSPLCGQPRGQPSLGQMTDWDISVIELCLYPKGT